MIDNLHEWLEADGLGGFASGTVSGERTRRYHALLLPATNPPTGRIVLVNGWEGHVTTASGSYPLSTQRYVPDVVHPEGENLIQHFDAEPWPTWRYELPDGTAIQLELFVPHESSTVAMRWTLLKSSGGSVRLIVRPLFSGRDYHALQHENGAFQFTPRKEHDRLVWKFYDGLPDVTLYTNASYQHDPQWYRQFQYQQELNRGLDFAEDLASPGALHFELTSSPVSCVFVAGGQFSIAPQANESIDDFASRLASQERRRRTGFANRLELSADSYIVPRGHGRTIVAGYPWFTDWGRDTFIALRGLCIATGRLDVAGQILKDWSTTVSQGMLPNRFPDHGETPEYNSVDASLWYIIAVYEYLQAIAAAKQRIAVEEEQALWSAIDDILTGYSTGTRYNISADTDGLLRAGVPGVQVTWMDAKVGDWVVTPRIGKPVEIQALWINALQIGSQKYPKWHQLFDRASLSFAERFWNPEELCLFDVIDVDHQPGANDPAVRPNQIFAVGGLPLTLLDGVRGQQIVDKVERELLTPLGLRSLSPSADNYVPHYRGDVWHRDGAYHQGTVWPWLIGPFVDAWLNVHGDTINNRSTAQSRFLDPLLQHLNSYGIGHVSEVADAEPSSSPEGMQQQCGGCPFQAWSLGELIRLQKRIQSSSRVTSEDSTASNSQRLTASTL